MTKRSCANCEHRAWSSWSGIDYCMWYEMVTTDEEYEKESAVCQKYEEGTPYCLTEEALHENDRDEWDYYWSTRGV